MKYARKLVAAVMTGVLAFTMLAPQSALAAARKTKTTPSKVVITEGMKQPLSVKGVSSVRWKIGNKRVATVSSKGVVKGKEDGNTTVSASFTKNGKKQTVRVKVTVRTPKIAQDGYELATGETTQLSIINSYKNSRYTWTSDDENVATVDKDGKVTAVASGSAIISVSAKIPATRSGRGKKTVTSRTEVHVTDGLVVSTQPELTVALARKASALTIRTDAKTALTIPDGNYSRTSLSVYAPNADITNEGVFKEIWIHQIAADTWKEKAKGNIIILDAAAGHIVLPKESSVSEVRIVNANSNFKLDIEGSVDKVTIESPTKVAINVTGIVGKVYVDSKAEVVIQGTSEKSIPIEINDKADGTIVSSNVKLDVTTSSDVAITVSKGAEGTMIKTADITAKVSVNNDTTLAVAITASNGTSEVVASGEDASVDGNGTKTTNTTPTSTPYVPSGNTGESSSGTSGGSESSGTGTTGGSTSDENPSTTTRPAVPKHTGPSAVEGHSTFTKNSTSVGDFAVVSETDYLWAKKKVIRAKYIGDNAVTDMDITVSYYDKDSNLISKQPGYEVAGKDDVVSFVTDIPEGYVTSSVTVGNYTDTCVNTASAYSNITVGNGLVHDPGDYDDYYEIEAPYTNNGYTEAYVDTVILVKYKGNVVSVWTGMLKVPGHSTVDQHFYPNDEYASVTKDLTVEALVSGASFETGVSGDDHSITYEHNDEAYSNLNHFSWVQGSDENIGNNIITKLKYEGTAAYCYTTATASFYDESDNLISSSYSYHSIYFTPGQSKPIVFDAPASYAKYTMRLSPWDASDSAQSADSDLTAGSVTIKDRDTATVDLNNSASTVIDKAVVLEKYFDGNGKAYDVCLDEIPDIQPGENTKNFYISDDNGQVPANISVEIVSAYKKKVNVNEPVSGVFYELYEGEETPELNHFNVVNAIELKSANELLLNFQYTGDVPVASDIQIKYYDADKNLISKSETQYGATFNSNDQSAIIFRTPSVPYATYCVVISSSEAEKTSSQISELEISVPEISNQELNPDDDNDNKYTVISKFTIQNHGTARISVQYAIVYMKDKTPMYIDTSNYMDYEAGSTNDIVSDTVYFDKDNVPTTAEVYIIRAEMN